MTSKVTAEREGDPSLPFSGRSVRSGGNAEATNFFGIQRRSRKGNSPLLFSFSLSPSHSLLLCCDHNPRDGSLGLRIVAALPLGGLHFIEENTKMNMRVASGRIPAFHRGQNLLLFPRGPAFLLYDEVGGCWAHLTSSLPSGLNGPHGGSLKLSKSNSISSRPVGWKFPPPSYFIAIEGAHLKRKVKH